MSNHNDDLWRIKHPDEAEAYDKAEFRRIVSTAYQSKTAEKEKKSDSKDDRPRGRSFIHEIDW
jgi:hypothetical protein